MKLVRRFLTHWSNILGLVLVAFFVFVALDAPRLAPIPSQQYFGVPWMKRINENGLKKVPQPPNQYAPLGTTLNQADVYYTLVWGAREAIEFGLTVGLWSAVIGTLIGAISGYLGGWLNELLMRITDGFLTFPVIAALMVGTQLKKVFIHALPDAGVIVDQFGFMKSTPAAASIAAIDVLKWSMILLGWMAFARIVNAMVVRLRGTEFIEAVRALGASPARLIFRHLIPNSISPAVVLLARDIGGAVVLEASLTYAGFAYNSYWGSQLVQGRDYIIGAGGNLMNFWWVWVPTTLALVLFGVGWNLLGDGLNDLLDPRSA